MKEDIMVGMEDTGVLTWDITVGFVTVMVMKEKVITEEGGKETLLDTIQL
jgi:hypothetical protein